MRTLSTTQVDSDHGNSLVAELLGYEQAYEEAKDKVTAADPFIKYFDDNKEITLSDDDAHDAHSLYIVAPNDPMESFSLIPRVAKKNKLGKLSKDALRRILGNLLDSVKV